MTDCLFCELYKKGTELVYENERFYANLDKFPVTPGHVEVIPKRHVVYLADLTEEEWVGLLPAIKGTIKVIEETNLSGRLKEFYLSFISNPLNDKSKSFCEQMLEHIGLGKKPDAYNHGLNDGEAAGRTIHHLHWHVIPRYEGDVENPRGGVRYVIPEKGKY